MLWYGILSYSEKWHIKCDVLESRILWEKYSLGTKLIITNILIHYTRNFRRSKRGQWYLQLKKDDLQPKNIQKGGKSRWKREKEREKNKSNQPTTRAKPPSRRPPHRRSHSKPNEPKPLQTPPSSRSANSGDSESWGRRRANYLRRWWREYSILADW